MTRLPVRVVKVGGSLFARPDLALRLQTWLQRQSPAIQVLIAGGGELADVIRRWDQAHGLGEERSHWLCIRALGISAEVLASLLPDAMLPKRLSDFRTRIEEENHGQTPALIVFDLESFLRDEEPAFPPEAVPHTWHVTTDSLAARLAEVINADELVLLKSVLPPSDTTDFVTLAAAGYVDGYFPIVAARLQQVRFDTV
jgi:5-(aminomethyl)-3-furanmethanol phosphate kinase